jgi:hypothetical protein
MPVPIQTSPHLAAGIEAAGLPVRPAAEPDQGEPANVQQPDVPGVRRLHPRPQQHPRRKEAGRAAGAQPHRHGARRVRGSPGSDFRAGLQRRAGQRLRWADRHGRPGLPLPARAVSGQDSPRDVAVCSCRNARTQTFSMISMYKVLGLHSICASSNIGRILPFDSSRGATFQHRRHTPISLVPVRQDAFFFKYIQFMSHLGSIPRYHPPLFSSLVPIDVTLARSK